MQLKQLAATCALLSATAMVQAKPIWQDFSVTDFMVKTMKL